MGGKPRSKPRYYDAIEAGMMTGTSRETVRRAAVSGELRTRLVNGKRRYTKSALAAWAQARGMTLRLLPAPKPAADSTDSTPPTAHVKDTDALDEFFANCQLVFRGWSKGVHSDNETLHILKRLLDSARKARRDA